MRATSILVVALALTACVGLPGSGAGIGIIEDEGLKAFLRPLALVEDQGCTLTVRGRPMAMRCRVFRGPSDERIAGVYDLVTDRPKVVLLLREDGRQEVLWLPPRQDRTRASEVML